MSYNITVNGRKADVLGQFRQQAASQRATLPNEYERRQLDGAVSSIESQVNELAGDDDNVAITAHGSFSQGDTQLGFNSTIGVTITKGAAAAPTAGGSGVGFTGSAGAPATSAVSPAAGAPTAAGGAAPAPTTPGLPGAAPRTI